MRANVEFSLSFNGSNATDGIISFYDVSRALAGFERSISLTTHLLLNGEVITQSPSARGFELYLLPPEQGSWKAVAGLVFGTALTVGVASRDSALGYLAVSALDYVIQQSLGFNVDFDKTLAQQLEEAKKSDLIPLKLSEDRFDSLIEKIEPSLRDCHRPIAFSGSAETGQIEWETKLETGVLDGYFDSETFQYISETIQLDELAEFTGVISSYNVNTFKGRIYVESLNRTLPFELGDIARSRKTAALIAASLYENTSSSNTFSKYVTLKGFKNMSKNNRLKGMFVTEVLPSTSRSR